MCPVGRIYSSTTSCSTLSKWSQKRWLWSGPQMHDLMGRSVISRKTKKIIVFYIGDHSMESCKKLWQRIPERFRYQPEGSSQTNQLFRLLSVVVRTSPIGRPATSSIKRRDNSTRKQAKNQVKPITWNAGITPSVNGWEDSPERRSLSPSLISSMSLSSAFLLCVTIFLNQ